MKKGDKILVRTGQYMVSNNSHILMALGLGSCVAITLYDEEEKTGGLLHYLLPFNPYNRKRAKYADTGIELLLLKMTEFGANRSKLKAKLFGGAFMFGDLIKDRQNSIGMRNIKKGRKVLKDLCIPIIGEDVGGNYGRSIEFEQSTGIVRINSYAKGEKTI